MGHLHLNMLKVPCGARLVALLSVLKNLFEREASQKVVVFFSTRDAVDFHHSLLSEFQWPPNSETQEEEATKELFLKCKTFRLHGSMEQEDRRSAFATFKAEKQALLLSTDVAARGLDFPKVRSIIYNMTVPGKLLSLCISHKGELKSIFVVKKLHLGHVAKSFALKEQPSLVGKSHHKETMKRKRDERQKGQHPKKRKKMSGGNSRSTTKT
ncbi:unnamed protein product [Eruca vesicaria subsp. sativa]|uniref:ATP-dependent RNA helicase n=1 Tax=Eruca vesicaria subsp. sativa TaxID=29727 RepID=A0ABC8MAE6_ERUVS|nr:unnamed protein product [Eruca vesicaria subsp. sativa]